MAALSYILILLVIVLSGCDADPASWIDKKLRTDESRRAHAATFVGIGTTQRAHRVAQRMAGISSASCARERPTRNELRLDIKRMRGEQPEVTFREVRTYQEGRNDAVRLQQRAEFTMVHGAEGRFHNEILVKDDDVWIRDDRSEAWYVREHTDERKLAQALGTRQIQVLLDALPGLTREGSGWVLGEDPLRCESGLRPDRSTAWLARLEGRGEVVGASFEHEATERRRTLRATWSLDKGRQMIVEATESWSYEPVVDMLPPTDDAIVEVERDRDLFLARSALVEMAEDGVVEMENKSEK